MGGDKRCAEREIKRLAECVATLERRLQRPKAGSCGDERAGRRRCGWWRTRGGDRPESAWGPTLPLVPWRYGVLVRARSGIQRINHWDISL